MMLLIPGVLSGDELADCRRALGDAAWVDGRGTAGHLSAAVKDNQQLHWRDPTAQRLGPLVVERLRANPMFLSAALPRAILPPLFNRYAGGGQYGTHLDGAIRPVEGTGDQLRTDLSLTLFLSDPADYDGGELVIEDLFGERAIKLPAGDAVLYPGTSLHRVTPVTRGERLAAFTWAQSLVRADDERSLLFQLDVAIQQIPDPDGAGQASKVRLSNVYHNLLRRWAET
jgi:PKHD-type hydroxylase